MSEDISTRQSNYQLQIEQEKTKQAEIASRRSARIARTILIVAMFALAGTIFVILVLTGQDKDIIKWAGGGMLTALLLITFFMS